MTEGLHRFEPVKARTYPAPSLTRDRRNNSLRSSWVSIDWSWLAFQPTTLDRARACTGDQLLSERSLVSAAEPANSSSLKNDWVDARNAQDQVSYATFGDSRHSLNLSFLTTLPRSCGYVVEYSLTIKNSPHRPPCQPLFKGVQFPTISHRVTRYNGNAAELRPSEALCTRTSCFVSWCSTRPCTAPSVSPRRSCRHSSSSAA